ncbi:DNA repair protein RecN [Gaiella sp.]|uniref:DNA repair protein RecN n=1 Tax=Gaiella sp. TaxID=2663207 RepID=UPI002E2F92A4|nr:AAA family ATPase [Gaiella sp.]HEX5582197.1 AAA family ATPase [Gaiella sp.]
MLRRLRIENLVLIREAELELDPGLVALTGETGAGKTIVTQAIGLLLGTKGDAAAVGAAGSEAFVEAELDVPEGFFDEDDLETLRDLRPDDEPGLVVARRVWADGRSRAYAWGRSVAREDLVAATDRLLALSGQFAQRRLARSSYQLDLLDTFAGPKQAARRAEAREAWRALQVASRRAESLEQNADAERARLAELEALVEDTAGLVPGEEDALRREHERGRHVAELGDGAAVALAALDPDDGDGARALVAGAERALAEPARLAPELEPAAAELRDTAVRLAEVASDLRRFASALEVDPARTAEIEGRLDSIADVRRRYRAASLDELLERRAAAVAELEAIGVGGDPLERASADLAAARTRFTDVAERLTAARREAADSFVEAVARELADLGLGDGEFRLELRAREAGPAGADEAVFLVRPNAGLPLAPVAATASGGELSRIALALAAVAGGETMVLDEIDAGVGGETAHRVAGVLRRLAERAQVITITHLPQIASVADQHLRVEKLPGDPTHTRIAALDASERRDELERMLGGGEFVTAVTAEGR